MDILLVVFLRVLFVVSTLMGVVTLLGIPKNPGVAKLHLKMNPSLALWVTLYLVSLASWFIRFG